LEFLETLPIAGTTIPLRSFFPRAEKSEIRNPKSEIPNSKLKTQN